MSERLLHWIQENLPFLYATTLSLWGGFVQYANRVRTGERWSTQALFLDLVVCSFAGLLAFFICQEFGIEGWKAAVITAVSAHEGTRSIGLLIHWRDKWLTK
jgi:hypothetical protein